MDRLHWFQRIDKIVKIISSFKVPKCVDERKFVGSILDSKNYLEIDMLFRELCDACSSSSNNIRDCDSICFLKINEIAMEILACTSDRFVIHSLRKSFSDFLIKTKNEEKFSAVARDITAKLLDEQAQISSKCFILETFTDVMSNTEIKQSWKKEKLAVKLSAEFDHLFRFSLKLKTNSAMCLFVHDILSLLWIILQLEVENKVICQRIFNGQLVSTLLALISKFEGHENCFVFWKLIDVLNSCVQIRIRTTCPEEYVEDFVFVLKWFHNFDLHHLPLAWEKHFQGRQKFLDLASRPSGGFYFDNFSDIRSLVLLVIKHVAALLCSGNDAKNEGELIPLCETCLSKVDDFVTSLVPQADVALNKFDWLIEVFLEQDDALIEILRTMLDIFLVLNKRDEDNKSISAVGNPHKQFYQLAKVTGWDPSLLIDWVSSPETSFLLYFIKYLKLVVYDWLFFVDTLRTVQKNKDSSGAIVENPDKLKSATHSCKQGKELNSEESETESTTQHKCNDDIILDGSSCSVTKTSFQKDEEIVSSEGLQLLHQYDSESSTEEESEAEKGCSGEVEDKEGAETKRTLSNAEAVMQNSGKNLESGDEQIVNDKQDTFHSLDQVLTLLIRFRYKLEHLYNANILHFNPHPLIKLILKCENNYESPT